MTLSSRGRSAEAASDISDRRYSNLLGVYLYVEFKPQFHDSTQLCRCLTSLSSGRELAVSLSDLERYRPISEVS